MDLVQGSHQPEIALVTLVNSMNKSCRKYTKALNRLLAKRIRVRIARKRNEEEDAKEELYSLVTVIEVPPDGFTSLGTKVIDEED
ncbi:hypothetical protein ACE6H2_007128 [Prunus campanulata]